MGSASKEPVRDPAVAAVEATVPQARRCWDNLSVLEGKNRQPGFYSRKEFLETKIVCHQEEILKNKLQAAGVPEVQERTSRECHHYVSEP